MKNNRLRPGLFHLGDHVHLDQMVMNEEIHQLYEMHDGVHSDLIHDNHMHSNEMIENEEIQLYRMFHREHVHLYK
jgi:hypothetical protein